MKLCFCNYIDFITFNLHKIWHKKIKYKYAYITIACVDLVTKCSTTIKFCLPCKTGWVRAADGGIIVLLWPL